MKRIDLNCDMGELPEAIADGTQEALLRSITSASVACGGHAGDDRTMRITVEQALRAGFAVAAEAFADRRYEPDGTLRSRKFENALIRDPVEAATQALSIAQRGIVTAHDGTEVKLTAQTICIHGDTPGSVQIAAAVARALREAGITLAALE